jgi:hypothetical protein
MRPLQIDIHPERIRISAEEILADLRYPAPATRLQNGRGRPPARRKIRR